jgi:hypothetical protein
MVIRAVRAALIRSLLATIGFVSPFDKAGAKDAYQLKAQNITVLVQRQKRDTHELRHVTLVDAQVGN